MSADSEPSAVHAEATAWYGKHWDPEMPIGQWWQLLADAGWAFPSWPEGFGGQSLNKTAARAALQARREAGAYGPPNGVATFLAAPTILHYGTEDQQRRYLPGIVTGRDPWCQLFSEPGSGSDMAGLATRAELDGNEWVISGQKVWNSGAHYANYGILIARTAPDQPKHRGITYFLIDMRQEGVDVRPLREMTGDAAFNEVFFNEARVPEADRLGDLGEGWRIAMTTLSHERDPDNAGLGDTPAFVEVDLNEPVGRHVARTATTVDGFSLAMGAGAFRVFGNVMESARVQNAEVMDSTGVRSDPHLRHRHAEIESLRRTARWSGERAAAATKAGGQPGPEISTLKLIGAEVSRRARDTGLAAMGPHGMLWGDDAPEDGLFHSYATFTPAMSIAGGSDEIQRNIIGERVLGLPREPGEAEQRSQPWSELPRS